jgi:hypothetical protein
MPPSRPPVRDKIGGENLYRGRQTPKFAQQILVFVSLFLSPGGGAAKFKTEINLIYNVLIFNCKTCNR